MEYSPPPLFKQGASARAKAAICALLALVLLMADAHLHVLLLLRQAVGTALYPLQSLALMPREVSHTVADYVASLSALEQENRFLRNKQTEHVLQLQQAQQLIAENTQLRKLWGAKQRLPVPSMMSEILYDVRDPFSHKVIVDRGSQQGVKAGQPVIDDAGIVGQVTRVFPFTAEVTLLTDKDQAIPVQVLRNGLRSVAYGSGQSGYLNLRFMSSNTDIQPGDLLVTSGIDSVYPAGLSVAKVVRIETKTNDAFSQIICEPVAGMNKHTQLLILLVAPNQMPRPDDEAVIANSKADILSKRRLTESARDKEIVKPSINNNPDATRKNPPQENAP